MRRIMLILLILAALSPDMQAKGNEKEESRSMLSLEMLELINKGRLQLCGSHIIYGNWALGWSSSINLGKKEEDKDLIINSLSGQFWPSGAMRGLMMEIGLQNSYKHGNLFFAGLGYRCKICYGFMLGLGYRIKLVESPLYLSREDNNFRLTLDYAF